jgi:hypothetical protein
LGFESFDGGAEVMLFMIDLYYLRCWWKRFRQEGRPREANLTVK